MVLNNKAGRHAIQYVWPVETGEEFMEERGAPLGGLPPHCGGT